jgi:hypothetical protein
MKTTMLMCSAFLCAALALPAGAQTVQSLKGDVPFQFSVGRYTLPAGSYSIQLKDNLVWFTNAETGQTVTAMLLPTTSESGKAEPVIEFHKYGETAFLSTVRTSDGSHDLAPSKAEREARRGGIVASIRVGLRTK